MDILIINFNCSNAFACYKTECESYLVWYEYWKLYSSHKNGRHFLDDIFKCIFVNENVRISINISPKFVPKGPINNISALVQIMARARPVDKAIIWTIDS